MHELTNSFLLVLIGFAIFGLIVSVRNSLTVKQVTKAERVRRGYEKVEQYLWELVSEESLSTDTLLFHKLYMISRTLSTHTDLYPVVARELIAWYQGGLPSSGSEQASENIATELDQLEMIRATKLVKLLKQAVDRHLELYGEDQPAADVHFGPMDAAVLLSARVLNRG